MDPLHIEDDELKSVHLTTPSISLPLFGSAVSAGFPSPADDYLERDLDIKELLIKHPASTFFFRFQGESSLLDAVQNGDIVIVDRSLEPKIGSLLVVELQGSLVIRKLVRDRGNFFLCRQNENSSPLQYSEGDQTVVWGVVTNVIRQFK